ncbi:MAG: glycosyltransferase family 4 protein [Candidatus Eremiobacteraeota bacterium]|nr:glycosyltransferase family 4 protein [Candidatus Eremiobacteraeota bacterium]
MAKVAMFVFNDGRNDLRVHRQASLLGRAGYQVRVYCFLEPGLPQREQRDHYQLVREDQRSSMTRFFDHQLSRFKKPRPAEAAPARVLTLPPDRQPVRPCVPPQRQLGHEGPDAQQHRDYIRRINRVWAERAIAWKPDVVQSHDLDALEAGVLVKRALGCPLLYDTHELWSEQPFINTAEAVDYWNQLEAELLLEVDRVLTINQPLADQLEARYSLSSVLALHNCQTLATPDPARRGRLAAQLGKPVALYQGAYAPDRGLEQVIASAAHQDQIAIALRGFGNEEASLRAMPGADRVTFLEAVPSADIIAAASEGDIGLIPFLPTCLNHYYSTPNKLFEYMMAGLPMAGSDIPEMQKFLTGHDLGVLFDPYSPSDIARALLELAEPGRRQTLGTRARRLAEQTYHWDHEGQKLLEAYARLIPAERR